MNKNKEVIQFVGVDPDEYLRRFIKLIDEKINKYLSNVNIKRKDRALSTKEAARYLGVTPITVHRWRKKKIVKAYKRGSLFRYKLSDLLASDSLPLKYKGRILKMNGKKSNEKQIKT